MTAYNYVEDVKKSVVAYLAKNIQTKKFQLEKLTFEAIAKELDVPKEKVRKALDELEEAGEILIAQSNQDIYVLSDLATHKNLKPFKLGKYVKRLTYLYISGLICFGSLLYLLPFFQKWILTNFWFSDVINIIVNSVALGLGAPLLFGVAINLVYRRIEGFLSKTGLALNTGKVLVASALIAIILSLYLGLSIRLKYQITATDVLTAIGAGASIAALMLAKEPLTIIKTKRGRSI